MKSNTTNTPVKPRYSGRVYNLLEAGSIIESFDLLRPLSSDSRFCDLSTQFSTLEETYRNLLRFLVTGAPDEERPKMLDEIRGGLRDLAQEVDRRILMVDDSRLYYSTARVLDMRETDLTKALSEVREASAMIALAIEADGIDLSLLQKKEDNFEVIFNRIWTLGPGHRSDLTVLADVVCDPDSPFDLKCLIISALLLGLLQYYDSAKMQALLRIYENARDERIAARSLTSAVLAVRRWSERIKLDRKVMARLETLHDSLVSYRRLREILLALIRTRDTDRVTAKMRDELIPDLLKMRPEIMNRLNEKASDGIISDIEGNPEWEEMLEKSGLTEKMRELSEMQSQGADVMMVAFSNLKSYPFFHKMVNWFVPYSTLHSQLYGRNGLDSEAILTILDTNGIMCDSDKFSFALTVAAMPEAQRKMALGQLDGQISQMKEELNEREIKQSSPVFDGEVTRYVRNLYRFFKLFSRHSDFSDPFVKSFSFTELPVIGSLMSEPEILRLVGEFYFKRGYYNEALPMLRMLAETDGSDSHLWEKTGYCLETLGDFKGALECYMKAELFNPDNLWVIKRLANTYILAARMRDALPYAQRMCEAEPDNVKALLQLADVYEGLDRYDDTLKTLHKADYISDGDKEIKRRICQGELKAGNADKCDKYIAALLGNLPSLSDYFLAGHVCMLKGNLAGASAMYSQGYDPKDSYASWRHQIMTDAKRFLPTGTDLSCLQLVLDKTLYDKRH